MSLSGAPDPAAVLAALGPLVVTLDASRRVTGQSRGDRFTIGDDWASQCDARKEHDVAVAAVLKDGHPRDLQVGLERVRVTRIDAGALALQFEPLRSPTHLERQMQIALNATGMGLWRWDPDSGAAEWDENMHALTGHPTPLPFDRFLEVLVVPEMWDRLNAVSDEMTVGDQPPLISRIRRFSDGEERWILSVFTVLAREDGSPGVWLGGTIDITDRQRMVEELEAAKRMEAIAHLTAGVAHNFNNMLMVVEPCLRELATAAPSKREASDDALEATRRAAEVVRQLMLLATGDAGPREPQSVDALCQSSFDLARRGTPRRVAMKLSVDTRGCVDALDGALEQVLDNLLANGRDAALESSEPTVWLSARDAGFEGEAWIQIVVADSGPGIADEHRERLFEPFHTTKASGTGLGLATSQRLVQDHGGQLAYRRTESRTEFLVLLPASTARAPQPRQEHAAARDPAEPMRVLLVDDEPAIRGVLRRGLGMFDGFSVDAAASANELRALLGEGKTYDAVLLDRSLGDADGLELAAPVRDALPDAVILFFTGEPLPDDDLRGADGVLHKPVSLSTIAETLQAKRVERAQ